MPERIAKRREGRRPQQSSDSVADLEHAERHSGRPGNDAYDHPEDRHEPCDDDRPDTISLEESVRRREALGGHPDPATMPMEQCHATETTDPVAAGPASNGPDPCCQHHCHDAQIAFGSQCRRREEHDLTREWESHPFERDEAHNGSFAVCANEISNGQDVLSANACTESGIIAEINARRMPRRKRRTCDALSGHEYGLRIRAKPLFRDFSVVAPYVQRRRDVGNTHESLGKPECRFRGTEKQIAARRQRR